MRVECANCHKTYNIPDEKLPDKKHVVFECPACKAKIKVDLSSIKAGKGSAPPDRDHQGFAGGETLKKEIAKNLKVLLPMPHVMLKAREIMSDPNSGFEEISKVLIADPAIAAEVLKLANSPYYGMSGKVSSINQAIILLGIDILLQMITVAGTSKMMDNRLKGYGLDSGVLWRHSIAVAVGSRIIAARKNPKLGNDAFSAGLIHDMGKIILDPYISKRKELFFECLEKNNGDLLLAERQVLGLDHSEIAYELCSSWKIPEWQAVAIRHHHNPSLAEENELAHILHAADKISMKCDLGTGETFVSDVDIEEKTMGFLGLKEEEIGKITEEVLDAVEIIEEGTL
ncbi:MAG: zinc-ribbon domain-containing protein [Deltaproteobacteria bacterium]|nr:zinc-ribbon domain-containing protein [Deltaproteobacteria bacterium]